jgi:hypothetical protein
MDFITAWLVYLIHLCLLSTVAPACFGMDTGSPLGLKPFIAKDKALVEKGAAHRHLASACHGNIFDLVSVPVRCTFAIIPIH